MREYRLVVVGYGMGAQHAKLIAATQGLKLHGTCDIDPSKREKAIADYPGLPTYDSFERVIRDNFVNTVVIVTPHSLHAEQAIAAMAAGKHVITDKAMCLTVREAETMIAARDKHEVLLTTFHNRRWDPEFITVRQIMKEGLIGRPYHIASNVTSWGKIGGWRAQRSSMGGWLYDWGAHTLDQILLLAESRPTHVHAYSHFAHGSLSDVEDHVSCSVSFESGLTASTVISYMSKISMPRWHIIGDRGALQADDFKKPIRVKTSFGEVETEMEVPLAPGDWQSFYQNFSETLQGGAQLAVKPEELVPQIAIAEAAYRSIEARQVMPVVY